MSDFTTLDRKATAQYGLLTRNQLRVAGWSDRKIRNHVDRGRLRRVSKHVFALAGSVPTWHQQVNAAVLAGGDLCAASHHSAGRLWGMRSVDDELDVSIRVPQQLTLPGVRVHRSCDLIAADITWVDGIATTTPDRTICDLGLVFPQKEVTRILRHHVSTGLLNRRDVTQIRIRNGKQGRNGVGVLGFALDALPPRAEYAESGVEVTFLAICESHDLPRPAMQLPVVVAGRSFRLDFAYARQRIFIEIDGAEFHSSAEQIANDGGRQNALVNAGWLPLRFTYTQLSGSPGFVARTIKAALRNAVDSGSLMPR